MIVFITLTANEIHDSMFIKIRLTVWKIIRCFIITLSYLCDIILILFEYLFIRVLLITIRECNFMEIVFRLIGFYYLLLYNIALISPHTAGEEVLL